MVPILGCNEGIHDGGLWGLDDLIDSVKKHDKATERIRERDGVKIKSKAIVLKNNLPKKKPPTFKELIVPSVQSTNALTMDLKTKKVSKCPFWKLQIFSVELYNHYWVPTQLKCIFTGKLENVSLAHKHIYRNIWKTWKTLKT